MNQELANEGTACSYPTDIIPGFSSKFFNTVFYFTNAGSCLEQGKCSLINNVIKLGI